MCKTLTNGFDQTEAELQKERNFAESLIEAASVIVLVLDLNGRIVRFNKYIGAIVRISLGRGSRQGLV